MTEDRSAEERLRKLRHDLASPLSAVLAEAQLLLMRDPPLDQEAVDAVREIESLCRRMGDRLQQS